MIIQLIDEAVDSGASREKATQLLGLSERGVARWRKEATRGSEERTKDTANAPAHCRGARPGARDREQR